MSNFTLAPWEIPPGFDIPLTAPAYTRTLVPLRGVERMVLIRVDEFMPGLYLIFAREQGDPEAGSWLLAAPWTPLIYWKWLPSKWQLARMVRKRFRPKSFWLDRVMVLCPEENSTPRYCLIRGGEMNKIWFGKPFVGSGGTWQDFRFSSPQEIRELSAGQVRDKVLEAWNQPESELRFTSDWMGLSEEERVMKLIANPQERIEMRLLMTYLLKASTPLWGQFDRLEWRVRKNAENHLWLNRDKVPSYGAHPLHNVFAAFMVWQRLLLQNFDAFSLDELKQRYLCTEYISSEHSISIALETPPTAHESLEAQLKLREWLQENAPAEMTRLQFWS